MDTGLFILEETQGTSDSLPREDNQSQAGVPKQGPQLGSEVPFWPLLTL